MEAGRQAFSACPQAVQFVIRILGGAGEGWWVNVAVASASSHRNHVRDAQLFLRKALSKARLHLESQVLGRSEKVLRSTPRTWLSPITVVSCT